MPRLPYMVPRCSVAISSPAGVTRFRSGRSRPASRSPSGGSGRSSVIVSVHHRRAGPAGGFRTRSSQGGKTSKVKVNIRIGPNGRGALYSRPCQPAVGDPAAAPLVRPAVRVQITQDAELGAVVDLLVELMEYQRRLVVLGVRAGDGAQRLPPGSRRQPHQHVLPEGMRALQGG